MTEKGPTMNVDEEELERLAVQEILNEAKRGAERAKEMGPAGWMKPVVPPTNKKFLENTLKSAARSTRTSRIERSDSDESPDRHRTRGNRDHDYRRGRDDRRSYHRPDARKYRSRSRSPRRSRSRSPHKRSRKHSKSSSDRKRHSSSSHGDRKDKKKERRKDDDSSKAKQRKLEENPGQDLKTDKNKSGGSPNSKEAKVVKIKEEVNVDKDSEKENIEQELEKSNNNSSIESQSNEKEDNNANSAQTKELNDGCDLNNRIKQCDSKTKQAIKIIEDFCAVSKRESEEIIVKSQESDVENGQPAKECPKSAPQDKMTVTDKVSDKAIVKESLDNKIDKETEHNATKHDNKIVKKEEKESEEKDPKTSEMDKKHKNGEEKVKKHKHKKKKDKKKKKSKSKKSKHSHSKKQ